VKLTSLTASNLLTENDAERFAPLKNTCWLVTGAAGFIGCHTAEALLKLGATVVGIDNFDPYYDVRLKQANIEVLRAYTHFVFYELSIEEPEAMAAALAPHAKALAKTGGVIHLASKAGVRPSLEEPQAYLKTNVEGTLHLLEWARQAGVKRWVFASSSSVYGEAAGKTEAFHEEQNVGRPISPYAATKVMAESLLYTYHHLHQFSVLALRFFTVYGAGQRPDLAIHKFSRLMADGQMLPVFGEGKAARDYTYISDTLSGILAACLLTLTSPTPLYEIVNLGNCQTHTVQELVEGLEEALGLKANCQLHPMQAGDVTLTLANIDKARRLLGYQPQVPLKQGLQLFAEWFKRTQMPSSASVSFIR
jgi:UDP-glucuronate 4-epimerase